MPPFDALSIGLQSFKILCVCNFQALHRLHCMCRSSRTTSIGPCRKLRRLLGMEQCLLKDIWRVPGISKFKF